MTGNEIEARITEHVKSEFMKDHPDLELSSDLPLIQEGIIDSLGIFLLIGVLEKEFGVSVAPEDINLENFETIDAMKVLVAAKLSLGSSGVAE